MCGEKGGLAGPCVAVVGSPPRVRGEGLNCAIFISLDRITPACAGRSRMVLHVAVPRKDHPRVCGEKLVVLRARADDRGSPPRVRGEGAAASRAPYRKRITPACAGRSASSFSPGSPQRDHPRVCGEKYRNPLAMFKRGGSPPRVRGEDREIVFHAFPDRITPACAERRSDSVLRGYRSTDHPRVRGEKSTKAFSTM